MLQLAEDRRKGLIHIQQYRRISVRKIVVLKAQQDVLTHDIIVCMTEDFFGRLLQQPGSELILFCKHLLVQSRIQFFIGHYLASSL